MLGVLRLALQVVLFFVLMGVVVRVGAPETGAWEKAVLVLLGAGLLRLAVSVRAVTTRPA